MAKYRKKPIEVMAPQWFKNGDHPEDNSSLIISTKDPPLMSEGKVVRCHNNPTMPQSDKCKHCGVMMFHHGWIDTLEDGHNVCPGDWIITGVEGEFYPIKDSIFKATYELVYE